MPKALAIDRDLVKSLFLAGFSGAQIQAKTGLNQTTLKTWANRFGWKFTRSMVQEEVESMPTAKRALTLKAQQNSLRSQAESILSTDLNFIGKAQVKTARGAYDRQKKLEPWVRNAKVICGWNEGQPNTLVNINVLSTNTGNGPKELTIQSTPTVDEADKVILIPESPPVVET